MTRQSIPQSRKHRRLARPWPRGVDRRAVARPRRTADDPAIDKIGAGGCDDLADADRTLRADRVAIDIDRLLAERLQCWRQPRCQCLGVTRRQDRQKEIGPRQQRVLVGGRLHPGGAGALGTFWAAARQQGAHLGPGFVQPPADAGPHHALSDNRDDRHCLTLRKIPMGLKVSAGTAPVKPGWA